MKPHSVVGELSVVDGPHVQTITGYFRYKGGDCRRWCLWPQEFEERKAAEMNPKGTDGERPGRSLRCRYRTAVLVGPWKSSAQEAAQDAIRAGQAVPCEIAKPVL